MPFKMKFIGYSKKEFVAVGIILFVIAGLSYGNFAIAERRSRDQQRKAQVAHVHNMLEKYVEDFGRYPKSSREGQLIACGTDPNNLQPCNWGWDPLKDVSDPNYPAYIDRLPADPQHGKGVRYMYFSDGIRYQLYASLEGRADEDEYDETIEKLGIWCGVRVCNFGKANGRTPLDKSLEEYENDLKS